LTATGQTMGTVRYMSPEQVRGQEVDLRTDIYSLGATLYESLVGDTPFDGETHFEIMTKHLGEPAMPMTERGLALPAALEDAVLKSLSKKPEDRFANARDFRLVLEQVLAQVDLAHGSTQRVSRDFMRAAKSPRGEAPIATAVTASKAGPAAVTAATVPGGIVRGTDVTEAASLLSVPVQKRSARIGLIASGLAVTVLGAAAATYFFALRSPASSAKPALWQPHEVLITQSADLADIALESVAASSPQAVAKIIATYRTARSKILAHVASAYAADSVFIPLRRIVEIPKDSVCEAIVKDAARLSCDDLAQYPFYFRFDDKTLFLAETANPDDLELMFLTAMVDAIPMGQQNDQAALKLRGELQTFVDSVAPKNTPAPK
ncbi:MAG: protein kinase, partial [Kofleriaceae bacterium]|nr:protein kinase [Kofleriaceae bacterium]